MLRYELFCIGPFDGDDARAFADSFAAFLEREPDALGSNFAGEPGVDLVDGRSWYARALDPEGVRALVSVLRAGLGVADLGQEDRQAAASLLDDMETWLARDYDPSRDQIDE